MSRSKPKDVPSPRASQRERIAAGPEGRSSGSIATAFAPHPALRATFSPLCGEKENRINTLAADYVGATQVATNRSEPSRRPVIGLRLRDAVP